MKVNSKKLQQPPINQKRAAAVVFGYQARKYASNISKNLNKNLPPERI